MECWMSYAVSFITLTHSFQLMMSSKTCLTIFGLDLQLTGNSNARSVPSKLLIRIKFTKRTQMNHGKS